MSRQAVIFGLLLGLFSTSISYLYGTGAQVEQLPIILHRLDPAYLANDFYVASTAQFGPRHYFAVLLTGIGQVLSLPWAYLGLTLLTDFALALVTLWAARQIIGSDRLGAALSAILVLGVSAFHLGDATQIRYEVFQPASLALPGAMWAVGLGLLGRPIQAAIVAALVSLAHPIYGVHAGSLALGIVFFSVLSRAQSRGLPALPVPTLRRAVLASALFGIGILVFWWLPFREVNQGDVTSGSAMEIIGRFRSPHHYLPSHFRWTDYVSTAFFLLATVLAFHSWSQQEGRSRSVLVMVTLTAIAVGCVLGGIFTETWPIEAVFTVQPFRLLAVLKWLGFLLIGWQLAALLRRPQNLLSRPLAAMSLLSGGVTQPMVTSAALLTLRLHEGLTKLIPEKLMILLAAGISAALWFVAGSLSEGIYLLTGAGLLLALSPLPGSLRLSASLAPLGIGVLLLMNSGERPVLPLQPLIPRFDYADLQTEDAAIARTAAARTPDESLFLAPPRLGLLRTLGRRAMVVDYKCVPFQNWAMREWRDRIRVVYGEVEGGGTVALADMDRKYRQIEDADLARLADRYGATHAILYAETRTTYPELYVDTTYRIVALDR